MLKRQGNFSHEQFCFVCLTVKRLILWFEPSPKSKDLNDRKIKKYVKLVYHLVAESEDEYPNFSRVGLTPEDDLQRNFFELRRHRVTVPALQSQLAGRRSVLNSAPFFAWMTKDRTIELDYRLLDEKNFIHPLSYDLQVSTDSTSSTSPDEIPLDTIAYHTFVQTIIQTHAKPLMVDLSFRIRAHAQISGREVNVESIRSHNAKKEAAWFALITPNKWMEIGKQYHISNTNDFSSVMTQLKEDIEQNHPAETIQQTIGLETITEAKSFLTRLIKAILKARIHQNCHEETLVGVNPLIGYIVDHPKILERFIQRVKPDVIPIFNRIFPSVREDESKERSEEFPEEKMDELSQDVQNMWILENEARYQAISSLWNDRFWNALQEQNMNDVIQLVCTDLNVS